MGSAASNQHRDIFKTCKLCLSDRNMNVRAAAARVSQIKNFEYLLRNNFNCFEYESVCGKL